MSAEYHRREGYRIIIEQGLWRSVDVVVDPPTATHVLRPFRSHVEASSYAEKLSRLEGWPILDRTSGDSTGGHAA